MGLFGFVMGLGKSQEQKMAIWILEHTQKHIAKMIMNSSAFWDTCKRNPNRKSEIQDWTGAAFISHFITCLVTEIGKSWEDVYMIFASNISSNMRNLIAECTNKCNTSLSSEAEIVDDSRFKCAEWLWSKMFFWNSMMSIQKIDAHEDFIKAFTDECLAVRAEIIPFKEKFL